MSITIENAEHVTVQFGEQSNSPAKAFIASLFGTKEPRESSQSEPPRIGAIWPGQGGIYVGTGRGYDGKPDHHLILATDPKSIFVARMLGTYGIDVTGAASDHDSLANTIALADAGSELCKEIRAVVIEGHNDFALMSLSDARLCLANVPELFDKEWHLTSTQYSSDYAWIQDFGNGLTDHTTKEFEARGRLVRRFFL